MQVKINNDFLEKLKLIYTKEELEIIEKGFSTSDRKTTFRINTLKSTQKEVLEVLKKHGLEVEKIAYLSDWYILLNGREKDLWNLDIFTSGKIYMQSISSQLVWEVVKKSIEDSDKWLDDLKVLDLTAAPWAKTSQISAIMQNKWKIVANELNKIRVDKLKFTLNRQWCKNVEIIEWDAIKLKKLYTAWYFDIIVADLPCSAEWRINFSREKSYSFLDKPGLNKINYKRQADIIKNNIDLLKEWWTLIYSTCTLDPQENEWILHFLLSNFPNLQIEDISDVFNNESIKKYTKPWIKSYKKYIYRNEVQNWLRILPSEETEGFFIAKIVKRWD